MRAATRAAISVYAKGEDYHELIKSRLKEIARWLIDNAGGEVKVFVDTAAVMEKPLAEKAGLGWQGKHTNLVSRAIRLVAVSRLDLHHARPAGRRSGKRRLRHLPRLPRHLPDRGLPRAVPARCAALHFLSDHRAQGARSRAICARPSAIASTAATIASPSARGTNSRSQGREAKLAARDDLRAPKLAELARLDDAQFRALFAKTSIKRTGRDRFVRNVLIAIGNSGDASLAPEAERLLDDASPLVRGAAVWALCRLVTREKLAHVEDG